MRKSKQSAKKVRITLDLSPEFYKKLEQLEQRADVSSKSQLIRESLQLYEYLANRYLEGDEFFIRTKDGEEKEIVLLGSASV